MKCLSPFLILIILLSFLFNTSDHVYAQVNDGHLNISIFLQDFPTRISGVTFDGNGFMYIAANGEQPVKRILKINSHCEIDTICSIECLAVIYLKVGWDNSLYASVLIERGKENASIFKIAPDKKVSVISDGFIQPVGITFDSQHNLYVVDAMSEKVYKITTENNKSVFIDLGREKVCRDILYHGIEYSIDKNSLFIAGINITGGMGNLLQYNISSDGLLNGNPPIVSTHNCKHVVVHDNKIFVTVDNGALLIKDIVTGSDILVDDPLLANSMYLSFGVKDFGDNSLYLNTFDKIVRIKFLP